MQVYAPIPAKKNNRVVLANGVNIPSREYREWHKHHYREFKDVAKRHGAFTRPVSVSLGISFKDRHRRDLDNALTSVLDLVKDAGIVEDDDWLHVPRVCCEAVNYGENYAIVTISPVTLSWWGKLSFMIRKSFSRVSTKLGTK